MGFAERMAGLTDDQRLHFYEVLAHSLTVEVRGVWSDAGLPDAEKVDRMKWVNEVLHSVTAKVWVLRLRTHEWPEADFGQLLAEYADAHPGIRPALAEAVSRSYRAVAEVGG
jgi:hypothetical protein